MSKFVTIAYFPSKNKKEEWIPLSVAQYQTSVRLNYTTTLKHILLGYKSEEEVIIYVAFSFVIYTKMEQYK